MCFVVLGKGKAPKACLNALCGVQLRQCNKSLTSQTQAHRTCSWKAEFNTEDTPNVHMSLTLFSNAAFSTIGFHCSYRMTSRPLSTCHVIKQMNPFIACLGCGYYEVVINSSLNVNGEWSSVSLVWSFFCQCNYKNYYKMSVMCKFNKLHFFHKVENVHTLCATSTHTPGKQAFCL